MDLSALFGLLFLGAVNRSGVPSNPTTFPVTIETIAVVGQAVIDGRVTTGMSVFLPVTGDANENATASLQYRLAGGGAYTTGPELFYVYDPKYPAISQRGFAGGLVGLSADTAYDIQVVLTDTDGTVGESPTQTLTSESTQPIPPLASAQATDCPAATLQALKDCVAGIPDMTLESDHYVIEISGTITLDSNIVISADGTDANRVMVRGTPGGRLTSIVDLASDHYIWASGDYTHFEDFTIRNSDSGHESVRVFGPSESREKTGQVIRGMYMTDIDFLGAVTWQGQTNVLITDNVIEGNALQGTDTGGGGSRAIELHGSSQEISYNTISGFVDGVVTSSVDNGSPGSRGVFIHHNEILWGVDDGIEADYTNRNSFIYHNSINNTPSGISFQPCIDGPCYAFYNLVHNNLRQPWKIKTSTYNSHGAQIFHNTAVGGSRVENVFGTASNHAIVNNLHVGQADLQTPPLNEHSLWYTGGPLTKFTMDYNAYFQDLDFQLAAGVNYFGNNLAEYQTDTGGLYAANSIILNGNPFENVTLNWNTVPWTTCRDLLASGDIEPTASTNALNAAMNMPYWNSNDGSADIGAIQRGGSFPTVGASWHTADACP